MADADEPSGDYAFGRALARSELDVGGLGRVPRVLLIAYRDGHSWWDRLPVFLQRLLTFLLVVFGWVLFRSATFADAATICKRMIIPAVGMNVATPALVVFLLIAEALTHFGPTAETIVAAGLRG